MTDTIITDPRAEADEVSQRIADAAAHLSGPALAKIIGCSPTTARRRLRGNGWTVSEVFRLCMAIGEKPSAMFATDPATRQ